MGKGERGESKVEEGLVAVGTGVAAGSSVAEGAWVGSMLVAAAAGATVGSTLLSSLAMTPNHRITARTNTITISSK